MVYRVYYNRSSDPQRWSIDEGTPATEITVLAIDIGGGVRSVRTVVAAPDADQPRGWFAVDAPEGFTVRMGIAFF